MRLLALFLLALPLAAQTFSDCQVAEIHANALKVECSIAGNPGSSIIDLSSGSASGSMDNTATDPANSSSNGTHYFLWYDSEGGETRYYDISFNSVHALCSGVCTSCDSGIFADANSAGVNGGVGSGLDCGGAGEQFSVTHPADDPTPDPDPPIHVRTPEQVYAQFDCDVVTCVVTDGVDGADVGSTYTSVKDGGDVQIVKVNPATPWTLERFVSLASHTSDLVVIEPDTAINISERGRAGPEHENQLLHVVPEFAAEQEVAPVANSVASLHLPDNVIIRQAWIHDAPKPAAPRQYAVSAVTVGSRQVTVDTGGVCPEDATAGGIGHSWWMLNLPGVSGYSVVDLTSGSSGCASGVFTFATGTWSGSYTSGGTLTRGDTHVISSVSADNPVQVSFSHDHGFPNPADVAVDFVYVGNVQGAGCSAINGVHKYAVVDADTISLTGVDGSGCTYEASDWDFVRSTLGRRAPELSLSNSTNAWCLQCIVGNVWYGQRHGGGAVYLIGAEASGFLDGTVLSGGQGAMLDPDTGLPVFAASTGTIRADAFRMDACTDCQIRNVSILGPTPTSYFNFQNVAAPPSDITIEAVTATQLGRGFSGANFPASLGLYSNDPRSCVEMKNGGARTLIRGVECLGAAMGAPYSTTGYAMFFAQTVLQAQGGTPRCNQDLHVEHSLIKGFSGGLSMGQQELQGGVNNNCLTERVKWNDNVFAGVLNTAITMVPPDTGTTTPLATNAGYGLGVRIGVADLQVLHNTVYSQEGATTFDQACRGFYYDGWRAPDAAVQGNIFPFHCTSNNGFAVFDGGAGFTPHTGTSSATRFASWAPYGDCQDNLFYQGLEDPSDTAADKSSSDNAKTKTEAEWTATFGGDPCAVNGPTDSTYAARHAALFPSGFMAAPAYAAYGVEDYDAHRRARGRVIAQKPVQTADDAVFFRWDANTTANCTVRVSENGFASSQTTVTATQGTYAQSVTVGGLTPLATVAAYLECPGGETHYWPELTLQ